LYDFFFKLLLNTQVNGLSANGGTPMAEGLLAAIKDITENAVPIQIADITIVPRIILVTDGEPDNEQQALVVAGTLGKLSFPITAMGVEGCKVTVMKSIASISGGVFLMINEIDKLVEQFLTQLFLILFIIEMQNQLENLYDTLLVKDYLEKKYNRRVSQEEVELFILILKSIVRSDDRPRRQLPPSTNTNRTTPLIVRPPPPQQPVSCCIKIMAVFMVLLMLGSIVVGIYSGIRV